MQWTSAPNIGEAPLPQRARSYWKTRFSAAREGLERLLEAERAQLPPWFVVGFGSGIAAWFALDAQRQWAAFLCIAAALALARLRARRRPGRAGARLVRACRDARLRTGLGAVRMGRAAAPRPAAGHGVRRHGRIGRLSGRQADGPAAARARRRRPAAASESRSTTTSSRRDRAGAEIELRARLVPPPPMALPGTYDFARDAWFQGIGAVGKALGPVTVVQPGRAARARPRRATAFGGISRAGCPAARPESRSRSRPATRMRSSQEDADAMRRSGLTHLLSVSGLHIAAVVAFAMFLTLQAARAERAAGAALQPRAGAAGVAAAAGIGYTLLTGAQVPTVRSCVAALLILGRESRSAATPSASA